MKERKRKHDDAHKPAFVRKRPRVRLNEPKLVVSNSGSVECPYCHWGFAPSVIQMHIRDKHE